MARQRARAGANGRALVGSRDAELLHLPVHFRTSVVWHEIRIEECCLDFLIMVVRRPGKSDAFRKQVRRIP